MSGIIYMNSVKDYIAKHDYNSKTMFIIVNTYGLAKSSCMRKNIRQLMRLRSKSIFIMNDTIRRNNGE